MRQSMLVILLVTCVFVILALYQRGGDYFMPYTVDKKLTTDSINGKAFGLYGDGVHDDTNKLNSLLDSGCAKLYLPAGTYLISKTIHIPDGVELFGDGEGTVIKLASSFTLTEYAWRDEGGHRTMYPLIYAHDSTTCRDFKIVGDTTAAQDMLQVGLLISGDNVNCHNVSSYNINYFPQAWRDWKSQFPSGYHAGYGPNTYCPGFGIFIFEASNVHVYGGKHENCGYQAIGTDHATDVVVDGLYCGDTNAVGLQIHRACKRIVFTNCIVNDNEQNHTSNFTIHGSEEDGVCEDLIISNCVLNGNAAALCFQSVWGYEKNVIITGCKMTSAADGIVIHRSPRSKSIPIGSVAEDFTITDNIIYTGQTGNGIVYNGDYGVITGNIVHYGGETSISASGSHAVIANNIVDAVVN